MGWAPWGWLDALEGALMRVILSGTNLGRGENTPPPNFKPQQDTQSVLPSLETRREFTKLPPSEIREIVVRKRVEFAPPPMPETTSLAAKKEEKKEFPWMYVAIGGAGLGLIGLMLWKR